MIGVVELLERVEQIRASREYQVDPPVLCGQCRDHGWVDAGRNTVRRCACQPIPTPEATP